MGRLGRIFQQIKRFIQVLSQKFTFQAFGYNQAKFAKRFEVLIYAELLSGKAFVSKLKYQFS